LKECEASETILVEIILYLTSKDEPKIVFFLFLFCSFKIKKIQIVKSILIYRFM